MTQQTSPVHARSTAWPGFRGEELDFIAEYASPRTFAKGSIVISEGDEALALYVVVSGELNVYTTTHSGREITLRVLGPGDYFGELTLFDDATRSASVQATEPCELLALPKAKLAECLGARPKLYAKLLKLRLKSGPEFGHQWQPPPDACFATSDRRRGFFPSGRSPARPATAEEKILPSMQQLDLQFASVPKSEAGLLPHRPRPRTGKAFQQP